MIREVCRRLWTRATLRGVHYGDQYFRLNELYRVQDPWNMDDEGERFRFRETNRLITEQFGRVHSLLEVGCGEGHQSCDLLRLCDRLDGIDVSSRAVERARKRCPQGNFMIGDVFNCQLPSGQVQFDLVVACEVVYYMADIPRTIERFSELGRAWLVTYYDAQASRLNAYFDAIAGVERSRISHGAKTWHAVWRRSAEHCGIGCNGAVTQAQR